MQEDEVGAAPMRVLALDPGPDMTAWIIWDGDKIHGMGWEPNCKVRLYCFPDNADIMAVEMIASYGLAVGRDVFRTCVEIGRFVDRWETRENCPGETVLIPRLDVKMHLCHTARAKDANISQALKDRFGEVGTKKNPGRLFGVKSHIWAALAVAVTVYDNHAAGIYTAAFTDV